MAEPKTPHCFSAPQTIAKPGGHYKVHYNVIIDYNVRNISRPLTRSSFHIISTGFYNVEYNVEYNVDYNVDYKLDYNVLIFPHVVGLVGVRSTLVSALASRFK